MTAPTGGPVRISAPPEAGGRLRLALPFLLIESAFVALLAAVLVIAVWTMGQNAEPAPGPLLVDTRALAGRMARLTLCIAFGVALAILGRRLRPPLLEACGFAPAARPVRTYLAGFVIGVLPVVALIATLVALGTRRVELNGAPAKVSWMIVKYFLIAIPLMTLEEGTFRGLVLGDFARAYGTRPGTIACSLLFAATHFLGTTDAWRQVPAKPEPVDTVLALFSGTERMVREWPELVGLFLVGLVLSVVRLRTGQLYLGMGIHAGWYWIKQVDRYFVKEIPGVIEGHRAWIGTSQYLDGVLGWIMLLLTLALAMRIRSKPLPDTHAGSPDLTGGPGP